MNTMTANSFNACPSKPRVLIIPAAGAGVRFRELGKKYPKCILPVQGKPIIATAISMLAEGNGVFDLVVIPTGSVEHKEAIEEALAPYNFEVPIHVPVVVLPPDITPSPAYSLDYAMWVAQQEVEWPNPDWPEDIDVTVFLSDLLPSNKYVAKRVLEMPTDTWGVIARSPGDYKRWCMVSESNSLGLQFWDKPSTEPPTNLAACGVYRYSSAIAWRRSFFWVLPLTPKTTEIQFSTVADRYDSLGYPLSMEEFSPDCFKDFGTLEEYLANKGISKCRSFNKITESPNKALITKSSEDINKIRDEAVWMSYAPACLKKYIPHVDSIDLMRGSVTMERIRSSNLRDIALYFDRSYDTWFEIFSQIDTYLDDTDLTGLPDDDYTNDAFWEKMRTKTMNRVASIDNLPESAKQWIRNDLTPLMYALRGLDYDPVTYYHGDLHFANMFYCFHYKDLKVIDPRGEARGSIMYDLAKLCHSVFGRYDYIDSEMYRVDADGSAIFYDRGHEEIEKAFREVIFDKLDPERQRLLFLLTASLFLSMIPLHADRPENCKLFFKEFERMCNLAKQIA